MSDCYAFVSDCYQIGVRLVPIGHLFCVKYAKCEIIALRVQSVVTKPLTEALAALLNAQVLNASTKRYYKTQALNATSNGGDASRVGN